MIRAVTAVLLAVALLAAVQPAVDAARARRTASALRTETTRLERAARALVDREDPTPAGVVGARRTVSIRVPRRGLAAAGVSSVRIGAPPNATSRGPAASVARTNDAVTYELSGGSSATIWVEGVDLRTPDGPVTFEAPGRHRVSLTLVGDPAGGHEAVAVRRFDPGRARGNATP
ncbi:MAG: hypothetical protein ABEJ28_02645 [Salinigranum sp.]